MREMDINDKFIKEYTSSEAIHKYTKEKAGEGISYLLDHDYGLLYLQVIDAEIKNIIPPTGLHVLEYGCGGGMNLIHMLSRLHDRGIKVEKAYGTDFSPVLISTARKEAEQYLPPAIRNAAQFMVARNESLVEDLRKAVGSKGDEFQNSFHLILGVNTFRYCFRLRKEKESARQIHDLLVPGGVSIMIDMNDRFPLFRSRLQRENDAGSLETYIPPLSEYSRPFREAGLEILQEKKFCWVPHSAGRLLCSAMRLLSPFLQACFQQYAMRSLVIARKPRLA